MRVFFTPYAIPVVLGALLAFWLVLRGERLRLALLLVVSVAVLALLHPAFAVTALGLVLVTHQLVEFWS